MRVEDRADGGCFLPGAGKPKTSAGGIRSGLAEPREGQHGRDEPEGCRRSQNGCPHEDPRQRMISCLVWEFAHERGGKLALKQGSNSCEPGVNHSFMG